MARDVFQMTLSQPDAVTGLMKALSGIKITVYKRGTTDLATIYQRPTGATQGPTPEAAATGGPNPFATGPSGSAEFWCDGPVEYDITIEDGTRPPRIPDRLGSAALGWNAFAAAPGSVPTSILSKDAGLTLATLAPEIIRQVAQIGEVIDWWRPVDTVPVPGGWEICDGHQIPAGSHEFPGVAGAINVPDLRNRMILGADPTKAQGTGANQGNAPTDAPAVAGTGGSNTAKDLSHGHGVPGIAHLHAGVDHLHGVGSLYTGTHGHGTTAAYTSGHNRVWSPGGGGYEAGAFANSVSQLYGSIDAVGNIGIGGTTGAADRALTTGANDRSLNSATNSTTWTADPGNDYRPRFFGLLKIMKVRRA